VLVGIGQHVAQGVEGVIVEGVDRAAGRIVARAAGGRGIVGDARYTPVGVVGVNGEGAVAVVLLGQIARGGVAILDDRLPLAVGQFHQPAQAIVGVIDGEAGLIDALDALAEAVVGELEELPVGVFDLGQQIGMGGILIEELNRTADAAGGRQHVAMG